MLDGTNKEHPHFLPLRVGDGRGRRGERIRPGDALRKRDHIADRRLASQQRQQAIQPDGEASMGRTALLQSVQEMMELAITQTQHIHTTSGLEIFRTSVRIVFCKAKS